MARRALLLSSLLVVVIPGLGSATPQGVHAGPGASARFMGSRISGTLFVIDSQTSNAFACAEVDGVTGFDRGCGPATVSIDPQLASGTASATIDSTLTLWCSGATSPSTISFDVSWTGKGQYVPGATAGVGTQPWALIAVAHEADAASHSFTSTALAESVTETADPEAQLIYGTYVVPGT